MARYGGEPVRPPLFDLSDFRIDPEVSHFTAASETPFLYQHDRAFTDYATDKGKGWPGRFAMEDRVESARKRAARLFHVQEEDVGFVSNVAEGVAIVAESLRWKAGDNICVDAADYPSVVLPFSHAQAQEVELRVAQGMDPDRFEAIVDENTRLISIANVSYITGERHDLQKLRQLADQHDAILLVDFTQMAGAYPVEASIADFAFSSCYKFLLGCTGVAIAYWNQERQPEWRPSTLGWYSVEFLPHIDYRQPPTIKPGAARFSRGNLSYPSVYVLDGALAYLATVEEVELADHIEGLATEYYEGLVELGVEPITPQEPRRRGPSICFVCSDNEEANALRARLAEHRMVALNIDQTIRVSFHGYNGSVEVSKLIEVLDRELPSR